MITVKCKECGNSFEAKRTSAKFCSPNCRVKFNSKTEAIPEEKIQPIKQRTKLVVDSSGLKEKPSDEIIEKIKNVNAQINKDFGAGTIMIFGERPDTSYQTISTGSLGLDIALGIGGLPRSRIVEIMGWESSGKTTIALNVIANGQKQGLKCLLVDAENAFDPEYAEALGVNIEQLEYCQPSCGEEGLEVADRKICTGEIGVVVIDSVAALIPKSELEGQMGDNKMGAHARLMSQACRKLVSSVSKTNTLCIFINQFRHKIGIMFGNPEVTTGGNALKFFASVRLEVSRSTTKDNSIMNGDQKEGNQTTVRVIKNKCAPPFRSAVFDILYGKGIDTVGEIIDLAIKTDIIKKSVGWFSYNESLLAQGKNSLVEVLEANPEVQKEIKEKIKQIYLK